MGPARPRVGTSIRNGCGSVTVCHKRREVYKGAPSLLRVPAREHAASCSSAQWFPRNTRKLKAERRDSIRSMDFGEDLEWDVIWLRIARRAIKHAGARWITGMHHVLFSLGFALHRSEPRQ
jgi:hypothetical protein